MATRHLDAQVQLSRYRCEHGSLRYDGDTEGADVVAAVAYLLSRQPIARQTVAGYSFPVLADSWPAPPMRVWQLWLG